MSSPIVGTDLVASFHSFALVRIDLLTLYSLG
jgi:hypothetical protein